MLLVLMSVAMAVILSLSFLNAQVTATGMSENVARRAQAKALAESGMDMALAYIETTSNWRTQMSEGTWVSSHAYAGGSIKIVGNDGQDTDGNGTIEGDGDLTDDATEPVTLTSTGTFDGVSHTVHAVVTPMPPKRRLLMVVADTTSLDSEEMDRKAQFVDWNYTVTLIGHDETQSAFDAAVANADVAYIPERVYSSSVNTKLTNAPIGVVCEEYRIYYDLSVSTSNGYGYNGETQINVTNTSHYITEVFSAGYNTIVTNSSSELSYISSSLAPGATVLAERRANSSPVLVVIDSGGTLANSSSAAGRRVVLPWGDYYFRWYHLTPMGLLIAQRSLEWASEKSIPNQIAHWDLDEFSGTNASDSVGGFDGTYQNGVTLRNSGAMVGSMAAQFDGSNDHVEIPHNDIFLLDDGTFAFWFKPSSASGEQGLLSKDSNGYDTGGHLRIWLHNDHVHVRLQDDEDSYEIQSGGSTVSTNAWCHVAFTFGSGGMKLYVNGTLEDTDSYSGGMGSTSGDIGNFEPMAIGVETHNTGDLTLSGWHLPFSGLIDEVCAFSRALTQTEIQSLMTPAGGSGLSYDVRWADQP